VIAVDSSVWIGHLRNAPTDPVRRFRAMLGLRRMAVGDIVLLEVLKGARDDDHAKTLERLLRQFIPLRMLDDAVALRAAANFRALRARGVTIRGTADLIVGSWCIANAVPLLHDDRDFEPMRAHLGLLVA
jgi:hypothetical protein